VSSVEFGFDPKGRVGAGEWYRQRRKCPGRESEEERRRRTGGIDAYDRSTG